MEFLLVNHPLDCPICDQGGECDLQVGISRELWIDADLIVVAIDHCCGVDCLDNKREDYQACFVLILLPQLCILASAILVGEPGFWFRLRFFMCFSKLYLDCSRYSLVVSTSREWHFQHLLMEYSMCYYFEKCKKYKIVILVVQDQSMAFGSDRSRFTDIHFTGKR